LKKVIFWKRLKKMGCSCAKFSSECIGWTGAYFICCGTCIGDICSDFMSSICYADRPFPFFPFFTFFVNVVPMFWFLSISYGHWDNSCTAPYQLLLLFNALFCLLNFWYVSYLYYKVSMTPNIIYFTTKRITKVVCYSPITFFYIFFWLIMLGWNVVGIYWLNKASCEEDDQILEISSLVSVVVMFSYMGWTLCCGYLTIWLQTRWEVDVPFGCDQRMKLLES